MDVANFTIKPYVLGSCIPKQLLKNTNLNKSSASEKKFDLFWQLRQWLNNVEVNEPQLARRLCQMIPAQCPFERKIEIFGRTLLNIPPLCKLNPLYNEVVALRFRAISYLADKCGDDVSAYC